MEIALERLLRRSGRAGTDFEKKFKNGKNLVCLGRDSSVWCSALFFLEDRGTPAGCRSSNESVFACAHGDCECLRLDACAGFMERMELALWNCE